MLVGHSYAGMVITEAAAGNDAVVALVYVNTFAPEHGESAFQLSIMFPGAAGRRRVRRRSLSDGGVDLAVKREVYHHRFCADVHEELAALMGATQRPATQAALSEPLPADVPAWKQIPSWFVLGDEDLIIPAALHRFMAERAGARGIREIAGASHAISVSNPAAVAATILDAVAATMLHPLPHRDSRQRRSDAESPALPTPKSAAHAHSSRHLRHQLCPRGARLAATAASTTRPTRSPNARTTNHPPDTVPRLVPAMTLVGVLGLIGAGPAATASASSATNSETARRSFSYTDRSQTPPDSTM